MQLLKRKGNKDCNELPQKFSENHTDKKENKGYKEIQKGSVGKSNMTNGLLIYD
jgi:hypothetical protein